MSISKSLARTFGENAYYPDFAIVAVPCLGASGSLATKCQKDINTAISESYALNGPNIETHITLMTKFAIKPEYIAKIQPVATVIGPRCEIKSVMKFNGSINMGNEQVMMPFNNGKPIKMLKRTDTFRCTHNAVEFKVGGGTLEMIMGLDEFNSFENQVIKYKEQCATIIMPLIKYACKKDVTYKFNRISYYDLLFKVGYLNNIAEDFCLESIVQEMLVTLTSENVAPVIGTVVRTIKFDKPFHYRIRKNGCTVVSGYYV